MRRALLAMLPATYLFGAAFTHEVILFQGGCERTFKTSTKTLLCALHETEGRSRVYGNVVFWPLYLAGRALDALYRPRGF